MNRDDVGVVGGQFLSKKRNSYIRLKEPVLLWSDLAGGAWFGGETEGRGCNRCRLTRLWALELPTGLLLELPTQGAPNARDQVSYPPKNQEEPDDEPEQPHAPLLWPLVVLVSALLARCCAAGAEGCELHVAYRWGRNCRWLRALTSGTCAQGLLLLLLPRIATDFVR